MQLSRLASLLIFAAIAVSSGISAEPVATVNGIDIDKKTIDQIVSAAIEESHGEAKDTPAFRHDIKNGLIDQELVLQEAKRLELIKSAEVAQALDAARDEILRNAFYKKILKEAPVTDAQITARYNERVKKAKDQKEVHAYQIVVGSEAEANKLISELKKGAKFTDLAKLHSLDPTAKETGGDMDWGNLATMEGDLAEVLKKLKKNEYTSKPFHSRIGWHIFKVEDIRNAQVPPLDRIKEQLIFELKKDKIAKAVAELRAKAKIQ